MVDYVTVSNFDSHHFIEYVTIYSQISLIYFRISLNISCRIFDAPTITFHFQNLSVPNQRNASCVVGWLWKCQTWKWNVEVIRTFWYYSDKCVSYLTYAVRTKSLYSRFVGVVTYFKVNRFVFVPLLWYLLTNGVVDFEIVEWVNTWFTIGSKHHEKL